MDQLTYNQPQDQKEDKILKEEYAKRFRNHLKEMRKSKKVTQEELASKAGLDLSYIGNLELGRYIPSIYIVWKISKVLGVSVAELADF